MADTLPDTLMTQRHQRAALIAGELAISASGELLRFHREGPDGFSPFGDPEPVAVLAEALLRTARIEAASFPTEDKLNADYVSAVGQLAAAAANFLEDQCSIVVLDDEAEAPQEPRWYWFAGYNGDVECEGLYALGEFDTRDQAIAAGRAGIPDIDGNRFFHIVEAQYSPEEKDWSEGSEFVPFAAMRNGEVINADPRS